MQDEVSKMGKGMFIAAWVVIFGLLIMYFSGMLDSQYNPNQNPTTVVSGNSAEVTLKANRYGHYVSNGTINGKEVTFLLDTGATSVTVGSHLADELGLVPGQRFQAQTANGTVTVARTVISELSLGDITLRNVEAAINPGMPQDEILLGMSALRYLELTQRADSLIIRADNSSF
ncbi:retropepsin-like aspartic protease family protein [Glaciecola sp. 1036]|uniref:retropepsin-like aspartic protease family protein n=1 Tax=Alteromonadaceae TaxID=72275 RepID=UPI003CFCEB79